MRIFISTGEVSGDLQGSLLIRSLQSQAAASGLELEIAALGGDKMAAAGAKIIGNTVAIGSVGLVEALPYILPTLQIQHQAKAYLRKNPPDLVVLIDYMGGNISIGNFIRHQFPQVPIAYYIAPQVWVSSITKGDTESILNVCDRVLAIFPAEASYFEAEIEKTQIKNTNKNKSKSKNITWVGHPLVDTTIAFPNREDARIELGMKNNVNNIALLPASRRQEIKYLLPVIFQAARQIQDKTPDTHFWIPLSLEKYRQDIEKGIQEYGLQATIISDRKKEVLAAVDLAITKCGTVNLELGLLNVPQVVVYRLSPITYWIAKNILKVTFLFASPVNLLVMKEIVPEFLQEQATADNITQAAMEFLFNPQRSAQLKSDYQEMRQSMGEEGVCDRAAREILQMGIGD
ncbi:MAG: lipid-A-disaccharide synthase [Cyanobacteria bacterium J06639_18]